MDMDELMSLLVKDESPSSVSDAIKDQLFSRTAEKIQGIRPDVAASVFDDNVNFDADKEKEFDNNVDLKLDPENEIE